MRLIRTSAAVLRQPLAPVKIESVSIPGPGPGEALIRMEACGICHSDLWIAGLQKLPMVPLILGHEGIGRVEAAGEGVTEFVEGERVGITFLGGTCGECEFCASGRERFCPRQVNMGYTRHGVLADYAVAPAGQLVRIPGGLPPEKAAPLCCAGWTAYTAIGQTRLQRGQTVALFGMGGVGHLGLQYARYRGLRVVAIDVAPWKLEFARQLGAEIALPAEGSGRSLLKQYGGVDAAVVFASNPAAVQEAFRALRRTGTLVLVGLSSRPWEMPVFEAILKGVTIRGSYLGTRVDLEEVLQLAVAGIGDPQVEPHALADTPQVLERLRCGEVAGRAVVVFC